MFSVTDIVCVIGVAVSLALLFWSNEMSRNAKIVAYVCALVCFFWSVNTIYGRLYDAPVSVSTEAGASLGGK